MPYTPVTPAQFKAAKPQFEEVPDATVQGYLDIAELFVDDRWPERFYQPAIIAVTCHLMTLDGLGTDPISQGHADGTAGYQTIRSGDLTLVRFQSAAQASGMSTLAWFDQTPCGQQYLLWVRMFMGGPRIVNGLCGYPITGYAKDYRDSWWPGC